VSTPDPQQTNNDMPLALKALVLFATLFLAWLLWSGIYKPLVIGLGVFSCVLTVYVASRVGFFRGYIRLVGIFRLPAYWSWLIVEIAKSSFDVARIVLSPRMPISPTVVEIDGRGLGDVGQAILGNAITLSPGTVTLDVYEGRLTVHSLTREGARALEEGEFKRRTVALSAD
jgi:multicomponent Na+:H+ antiporter subunit E